MPRRAGININLDDLGPQIDWTKLVERLDELHISYGVFTKLAGIERSQFSRYRNRTKGVQASLKTRTIVAYTIELLGIDPDRTIHTEGLHPIPISLVPYVYPPVPVKELDEKAG